MSSISAADQARRRSFGASTARHLPLLLSLAGLPLAWVIVRRAWPDADLFIRSASGVKEAYLGVDFINMWFGARLALAGTLAPLFDIAAYQKVLQSYFGSDFPFFSWSYPPHLLLLVLPLGVLPYFYGLATWTLATVAAFLAAAMPARQDALRRPMFLALLLAPSTLVNASAGQNGCLTAALLVGGLRLVPSRPVIAGLLFGILTTKPHLGLVLPIMLMAMGAWRCIASAAAATLCLLAASWLAFSTNAWSMFFTITLPHQASLLANMSGSYTLMMASVYRTAYEFGIGTHAALLVQTLVAVLAVGAAIRVVRRSKDSSLRVLAIVAAIFLALPYTLYYDLASVTAAVALYLARRPTPSPAQFAIVALAWFAAPLTIILDAAGLPVVPLIVAALLALAVHECGKGPLRVDGLGPMAEDTSR